MKNVLMAIVVLGIFSLLSVGSAFAQVYRMAPQQQLKLQQLAVPAPQATTGAYADVRNLKPFSAGTDHMSLAGYLRYLTHQRTSQWLTYPEATRIVRL
jgi:hypothetical protein